MALVYIGQQLPAVQFRQFVQQVKVQYGQMERVGFYNTAGKLQAQAVPDDATIAGIREIYANLVAATSDLKSVAAADWDRIDSQRRYNGAVRRRQLREINNGLFGTKGKRL